MNKVGLIFFCPLLFLTACASHKQNERLGSWRQSSIHSGSSEFDSSRLSYVFAPPNNALELQILQTKEGCKGYLCIHRRQMPANIKKIPLTLEFSDKKKQYFAEKHQGGQKLSLPQEALEELFTALKNEQTVLLTLSGHQMVLSPEGFLSEYKKFQNPSILPKLIQMPF